MASRERLSKGYFLMLNIYNFRGCRLCPAKEINLVQKIDLLGSRKACRKTGNRLNGKCFAVVPVFARARLCLYIFN